MLTDEQLAEMRQRSAGGYYKCWCDEDQDYPDTNDVGDLLAHIDELATGSFFMAHPVGAWMELRGEMIRRTGRDDPREWAEWIRLATDPNAIHLRVTLPVEVDVDAD